MPSSTTRTAKAAESTQPLSPQELRKVHAYWRAANYLSVGQIYLFANPLLHEPLQLKHIKPRLLGHWGTTPGLNFIYVHLNRLIKKHDLDVIYVAGPGHGGPGLVANTFLEGTYSEVYPHIPQNARGCSISSSNSRFRGAFRVTLPRKRRDRFTRAANSVTPLLMRMERRSTIPICWCVASLETAKRKPAHWRQVGIQTNF